MKLSNKHPPELTGFVWRVVSRLMHLWHFMWRGMTLGVRAACFDEDGRIFLVRHTCYPGWFLPGGGVEHGETMPEALAKELAEEGNLEITGPVELFAAYYNSTMSKRDHVLLYICRHVRQTGPRRPDHEIAECGFFALDALPQETTPATKARLAEIAGEVPVKAVW